MERRRFLALLVWLLGWSLVAAVLAALFFLLGSVVPSLKARLLPFLLVDLFVVFPVAALAATRLVWPAGEWSRSRTTRLHLPVKAGSEGMRSGGHRR